MSACSSPQRNDFKHYLNPSELILYFVSLVWPTSQVHKQFVADAYNFSHVKTRKVL